MRPFDTSAEAHAAQIEFYRCIGVEKRLELGLRMSNEIRKVASDGIRMRHPGYTAEEVKFALFRLILGDALFMQAWPHAPLLAP